MRTGPGAVLDLHQACRMPGGCWRLTWIKQHTHGLRMIRALPFSTQAMTRPDCLDEASLAALVDRFYEKVRLDPMLGPVFNGAVHDWDQHKQLLTSFWSSVALRAGTYRGNPMGAHRAVPDIRAEHFEHWLALWRETTMEVLDSESAARMVEYAERIGSSLRMGLGLDGPTHGRGPGIPDRQ